MSRNSVDTQISKTLSYILRHGAEKEGIQMTPDGFVRINDILAYGGFRVRITKEDILKIVQTCPKQRFAIKEEESEIFIRANQGHSLKEIKVDMLEITNPKELENCIHGTYLRHWESIKKQGLSRMNRQHIHFTTAYVGADTVISGMRSNCQLAIHINTDKALKEGLKFYQSANGVILTEGDEKGFLLPKYFLKVVNLKTICKKLKVMSSVLANNPLSKKYLKTATVTVLDNTDANSNKISNNKENTILTTTTSNYQVNNTFLAADTLNKNDATLKTRDKKVTLSQPLSETLLYDPKLTRRNQSENYEKPVTERETWWRVDIKETPLPQTYETTKNSFLVDIAKKPNTYSFKSDGRRLDPIPQIRKGEYLLPGSYEFEDITDRIARMKVTYGFKGPDRESLLEKSLMGIKDKDIQVGPAAYQVEKYFQLDGEPEPVHHGFFKSKTKRRVFIPRDGPPPGCYEVPVVKKKNEISSCFKSKTSRFKKSHTATPGPGAYWPLTQWPLSKSLEKLGDRGVRIASSDF